MQQLVQDRQDEHAGDGDQDGPNKHQSDEMDNFARYMMEMDDSEEGDYHRVAEKILASLFAYG